MISLRSMLKTKSVEELMEELNTVHGAGLKAALRAELAARAEAGLMSRVAVSLIYRAEAGLMTRAEAELMASAKVYRIFNPDGEEIEFYNLNAFCRENGLSPYALGGVINGTAGHHKGWRNAPRGI